MNSLRAAINNTKTKTKTKAKAAKGHTEYFHHISKVLIQVRRHQSIDLIDFTIIIRMNNLFFLQINASFLVWYPDFYFIILFCKTGRTRTCDLFILGYMYKGLEWYTHVLTLKCKSWQKRTIMKQLSIYKWVKLDDELLSTLHISVLQRKNSLWTWLMLHQWQETVTFWNSVILEMRRISDLCCVSSNCILAKRSVSTYVSPGSSHKNYHHESSPHIVTYPHVEFRMLGKLP